MAGREPQDEPKFSTQGVLIAIGVVLLVAIGFVGTRFYFHQRAEEARDEYRRKLADVRRAMELYGTRSTPPTCPALTMPATATTSPAQVEQP